MPEDKPPEGSEQDHLLDKEAWIRLSIHDVTEESKKRLYQSIYLIGGYAVILVSLCAWFALTNINEAIEAVVGTPDHPTEFIKAILTESIDRKSQELQTNIIRQTDSNLGELLIELEEETDRKIDYRIKEINASIGGKIEKAVQQNLVPQPDIK